MQRSWGIRNAAIAEGIGGRHGGGERFARRASTTDVRKLRGKGYSTGAYCSDFGGTSSATPLVAGVAALVLSADTSLRWDQVRDILASTADKIDRAGGTYRSGHSLKYGFGRVNAEAAVTKAMVRRKKRAHKAAKKRYSLSAAVTCSGSRDVGRSGEENTYAGRALRAVPGAHRHVTPNPRPFPAKRRYRRR